MKRSRWAISLLGCSLLLLGVVGVTQAADAPPEVATALIVKLAAMEKNLANAGGDISIHVVGSPTLADALREAVGKKIGKGTLAKVTQGDGLPSSKPTIVCVAAAASADKVITYTRNEKILSVTNMPDLVGQGVSLGIGVNDGGKPEVKINMEASKAEGLDWNPAILKIAKTV